MLPPDVSCRVAPLATGVVAFVDPDGGWGLSNAGLVLGERDSLQIDTLFDLTRTRQMLDALRLHFERDDDATIVVNTHANGDHCYGNCLLKGRRIIASSRAVREMRDMPARKLRMLLGVALRLQKLGGARLPLARVFRALRLRTAAALVDAAPYVLEAFSHFEFASLESMLPNECFDGELEVDLGGRRVQLLELGPAHTDGDVVVFVPDARILFAGDLLFEGMHPLIWSGTLTSYRQALARLLALDPETVVPGHGPLTDRSGILRHLEYLDVLLREVRPHFEAGRTLEEAAAALIAQGLFDLRHPERLVVNVGAAYRDFGAKSLQTDVIAMFGAMARLAPACPSSRC